MPDDPTDKDLLEMSRNMREALTAIADMQREELSLRRQRDRIAYWSKVGMGAACGALSASSILAGQSLEGAIYFACLIYGLSNYRG